MFGAGGPKSQNSRNVLRGANNLKIKEPYDPVFNTDNVLLYASSADGMMVSPGILFTDKPFSSSRVVVGVGSDSGAGYFYSQNPRTLVNDALEYSAANARQVFGIKNRDDLNRKSEAEKQRVSKEIPVPINFTIPVVVAPERLRIEDVGEFKKFAEEALQAKLENGVWHLYVTPDFTFFDGPCIWKKFNVKPKWKPRDHMTLAEFLRKATSYKVQVYDQHNQQIIMEAAKPNVKTPHLKPIEQPYESSNMPATANEPNLSSHIEADGSYLYFDARLCCVRYEPKSTALVSLADFKTDLGTFYDPLPPDVRKLQDAWEVVESMGINVALKTRANLMEIR
ncbi:hypothetical protein M8J77_025009 [Diaphorina citri]|nr:hypothetical protein M8J77_025009 [Diaphorina citri]